MVNNTYTLKLAIDPSNLFGGKFGTSKESAEKKPPSLFDSLFGSGSMNVLKPLAKLGIISTGVLGIHKLLQTAFDKLVNVAPTLQAMMKLMNVSIAFMLRPIADFFAFLLRPILIYFLRYIAIPFYRYFTPIARSLGQFFGQPIGDLVKTIADNLEGALAGGAVGLAGGAAGGAALGALIGTFIMPGLGTVAGALIGGIGGAIIGAITGIPLGAIIQDWLFGNSDAIEVPLAHAEEELDKATETIIDVSNTFGTAGDEIGESTTLLDKQLLWLGDSIGIANLPQVLENLGIQVTEKDLPLLFQLLSEGVTLADLPGVLANAGFGIDLAGQSFAISINNLIEQTNQLNSTVGQGASATSSAFAALANGINWVVNEIKNAVSGIADWVVDFFTFSEGEYKGPGFFNYGMAAARGGDRNNIYNTQRLEVDIMTNGQTQDTQVIDSWGRPPRTSQIILEENQ